MEPEENESIVLLSAKLQMLKQENEALLTKNTELEKVYAGFFLKLDFYMKNSNVHPPEEIDVQIYKNELHFNMMEDRWKIKREELIKKYETKIQEIAAKINETPSPKKKPGSEPVPLDLSKEDLVSLRAKLEESMQKEKEMRTKLVEAAKRMKVLKDDNTAMKQKLEENDKEKASLPLNIPENTEDDSKKNLIEAAKKIKEMKEEIISLIKKNEDLEQELHKLKAEKTLASGEESKKVLKEILSDFQKQKEAVVMFRGELKNLNKSLLLQCRPILEGVVRRCSEVQGEAFNELRFKYVSEMNERKKLFNILQELKGNIRVFCRVRPLNPSEPESCIEFQEENILTISSKETNEFKNFEYDRVFNQTSKQEEVFAEVQPLITSILDGYNVCIFAYGQTGSGKTYTMQGPKENPGVFTRAINELFRMIKERQDDYEYALEIALMEIYNENLRDLFGKDQNAKLEIKQGPNGNFVPGLTSIPVKAPEEVESFLEVGTKNRAVGKTNMNEHSSRSHLIFTINLIGKTRINNNTFCGKLHLIDLAGSERLAKTKVQGEAQKESIAINKSLTALGDVIAARANKTPHIPFRNSTLTYFLQDSLSGESKTLMVLQISPASTSHEETVSSCKFAARARSVELGSPVKKSNAAAKK